MQRAEGIVQLVSGMVDPAQKNAIMSLLQHAVHHIRQHGYDPETVKRTLEAYKQNIPAVSDASLDKYEVAIYEALLRG